MQVTIFGAGYVGLVTAACLAEVGNNVVCVDVDALKIATLNNGGLPLFEPGLDRLVQNNQQAGRLRFTTVAADGVNHGQLLFIAVGTPPDEDGSADLRHVLAVARTIGTHLNEYRVVINKSTVPIGTADQVAATLRETLMERGLTTDFDVVSNPEFLKEGAAIEDFMRPDRIVIGTNSSRATELLRRLYAPFNRSRERLMCMDVRSAELTKYAANALLATKISFMNELSNIADAMGADIEQVRQGIGSDPRIGYSFIYPGCGYGGSCFPKDVCALEHTARTLGCHPRLLNAVATVNYEQKQVLFRKLHSYFQGDLQGRVIALWGLAFKPNTDDMREAASRVLMEALWAAGAKVQAFDPVAMPEARRVYGMRPDLELVDSPLAALTGADVLVIVTEWSQFRSPDFTQIRERLTHPVIFDGRNLFDPQIVTGFGLHYFAMGRPAAHP